MVYVKTFKGYEDKIHEMDAAVNGWVVNNAHKLKSVRDIKAVLSHEHNGRAGSGDLLYVVLYESSDPIA
ncbi:MAG TPA: hypothetical protein PLJ47_02495 [Candidatus Hydrogenedentes bacterium]|nr:hypothetical protein [Candidatus Hydrogenedentota bacterium]HRK33438.1 hypothetical protein [Candidatus Hydrogenedentota bacterium]